MFGFEPKTLMIQSRVLSVSAMAALIPFAYYDLLNQHLDANLINVIYFNGH